MINKNYNQNYKKIIGENRTYLTVLEQIKY